MTSHSVVYASSSNMKSVADGSVDLIVTSPQYPMIEMWDEGFVERNPKIGEALSKGRGREAFDLMHEQLGQVWKEAYRVLGPGRIMCVNIGDAVRTVGGNFKLYCSHSRVISECLRLGFQTLPCILWRKSTNAPNKFMGSGMLPPGAYVTLEHEFILVFRKGRKREFKKDREKKNRLESGFFWEERNRWFSDVWTDLKGVRQEMDGEAGRERSGAFPFELAYRLINMFSVKGDTVLDPFLGTGTTMFAAMASERNSVGYEVESSFEDSISKEARNMVANANAYIRKRLEKHVEFCCRRLEEGKPIKHINIHYGFPCVSRQERSILINDLKAVSRTSDGSFSVSYASYPQKEFTGKWAL